MADHRPKRLFRNYLLNRRLQLGYAVSIAALSTAITSLLGLVIYQQRTFASARILAALDGAGMEWLGPVVRAQVASELGAADTSLVTRMVGLGILLALGLLASLIVMTHKVAGPLWRMSRCLDTMVAGELPVVGPLRRGDQLKELFATLDSTIGALRERRQRDAELVAAVVATCAETPGDRDPMLAAALADLARRAEAARPAAEGSAARSS